VQDIKHVLPFTVKCLKSYHLVQNLKSWSCVRDLCLCITHECNNTKRETHCPLTQANYKTLSKGLKSGF